ncbi:hypothetical protein L1887_15191 [Cichorium endivia]|nr:hypothetical protein L1887_15191 [Cichorium endivia]
MQPHEMYSLRFEWGKEQPARCERKGVVRMCSWEPTPTSSLLFLEYSLEPRSNGVSLTACAEADLSTSVGADSSARAKAGWAVY